MFISINFINKIGHTFYRRELPVEKATSREKGQPLCMAQYYRLMKSYREPGLVKDRLIDVESDLTLSRPHIIVACKSQVRY